MFWKKAKNINVGECERTKSVDHTRISFTTTAWADGSDRYPGASSVLNTLPTHSCSMYERNKGRALKGEI